MKRVVDGVTFNTETSTAAARWEYENQSNYDVTATLYQTRGGAFFVVHQWRAEGRERFYFEAMSRDEVARLVTRTNNLMILNEEILQEPPEAADEAVASATLYIRLPTALKSKLERLAAEDNMSLNAWTMKCTERCASLDQVGRHIGEILQTVLSYQSLDDPPDIGEMFQHIFEQASEIGGLLGWRGKDLENLGSDAALDAAAGGTFHRHWQNKP